MKVNTSVRVLQPQDGKLPKSLGRQLDYDQRATEHPLYARPEPQPEPKYGWALVASFMFSATVWAFALYGFWCFVSTFWEAR